MVFSNSGWSFSFANVSFAVVVLLMLAMARIWIFYRFQMRAIQLIAPRIRKAKCRQLYGHRVSVPVFRLSLRGDLRMIFDLSKWRFRDFYPDLDPYQ